MLPKLQQSSLANSLRRDNLASQIQCKIYNIQARISSRTYSNDRTISHINLGRMNLPPKIHTRPSETSPNNTFQKTSSKILDRRLFTNLPFLDHQPSTPKEQEQVAKIQALLRRSLSFKSQPQNQEPLRKDKFRPQNFVDIMTVEIFRFGSITRIRCLS